MRDDFDRWWVTATLHDKVMMGVFAAMGMCYLGIAFHAIVTALRGPLGE